MQIDIGVTGIDLIVKFAVGVVGEIAEVERASRKSKESSSDIGAVNVQAAAT